MSDQSMVAVWQQKHEEAMVAGPHAQNGYFRLGTYDAKSERADAKRQVRLRGEH